MNNFKERISRAFGARNEQDRERAQKLQEQNEANRLAAIAEQERLITNQQELEKLRRFVEEIGVKDLLEEVRQAWGCGSIVSSSELDTEVFHEPKLTLGLKYSSKGTRSIGSTHGESGITRHNDVPATYEDYMNIEIYMDRMRIMDGLTFRTKEKGLESSWQEEKLFRYYSPQDAKNQMVETVSELTEKRIRLRKLPRD